MAQEKILYIGRHAKSSWDFPGRADIDRPLAERGIANAYDMANRMNDRGDKPGHIISSPANRALHTAIIFARQLKIPFSRLAINENLYMGGEDSILEVISRTDSGLDSLMIFGHNPDFTYLANYFLKDRIYNIPTCGLVRLNLGTPGWEGIRKAKLLDYVFDFPKKK
jgi:phosphohistidine phosphatase